MKFRGRPTLEQQQASDEFSNALLNEYNNTDATYRTLANKHGISRYAVFTRLQKARYREMGILI